MTKKSEFDEFSELLTSDEPALSLTAPQVRSKAQSVRRKRRLGVGIGACALAAAGVVATPAITGLLTEDSTETSAANATEDFSPDDLTEALRANGERYALRNFGETSAQIVAWDAQSNEIAGDDRDKATIWFSSFDYSPTNILEIRLTQESSNSVDSEQQHCVEEVEAHWSVKCEASALPDGTVIREQTRGVTRQPGAWPVVTSDKFDSRSGHLWFQRMIRAYHPEGGVTAAVEFIKADSAEEAVANSTLSDADLSDIALDPALRFPEPPQGENGCGWVIPEKQDLYGCK